jgi:hypothetical protein
MPDSGASNADRMTDMKTLHLIALQQGVGVRRCGPVDDDRYDRVNSDDESVVARGLSREQVAAELLGDEARLAKRNHSRRSGWAAGHRGRL